MQYINSPDVIVWHNVKYDEEILKLELRRLGMEYKYKPKQVRCTMKETVDFCSIKGTWERFKYAKLWELHKKLFDEYFIWAHDAIVDVEATLRCFVKLVNIWVIKINENKKDQIISLF
jgi:DNA polymerase III epsilon subunit-like protein